MQISVTIPDEYLDATLCIDIVYVNTLFFLHTKTEKVNYYTNYELKRRTLGEIKRVLKLILELYSKKHGLEFGASLESESDFVNIQAKRLSQR